MQVASYIAKILVNNVSNFNKSKVDHLARMANETQATRVLYKSYFNSHFRLSKQVA